MYSAFNLQPAASVGTVCLVAALALQGCGGGGDNVLAEPQNVDVLESAALYWDAPLTPSSRLAGGTCTDLRQKQFIRSYLDEVYLWPERVQRLDARAFTDAQRYFAAILAPPSLDRFSYSSSQAEADAWEVGAAFDAGIHWTNTGSSNAPLWRVSRVDPDSPADRQGIQRGDTLVGKVSNNLKALVGPYYYNFTYQRNGVLTTVSLTPTVVTEDPVGDHRLITAADGRQIGYLAFDAHFGNAQDQLIEQIEALKKAQVRDVVIDLRYNTGGYLFVAASLASMLAPQSTVQTRPVFERLQPNLKQQALYASSVLLMSPTVLYSLDGALYRENTSLPNLNLNRVYVLTSDRTCSASESLVNGLRGIGLTVELIGNTTCGKPYGMLRRDNCGVAYFPIEFRGVNALGRSDFLNGFEPTCQVADDLDHARGSLDEAMLKAALNHMETGSCPASYLKASPLLSAIQKSAPSTASTETPPQRTRPGLSLRLPP
jgi:carboxyl-terminal processing protease